MLSVIVRSTLTKYRGLWVPSQSVVRAMSSSAAPTSPYTTLAISHPAESVTHVELHRPEKRNAMNKAFWSEMVDCFNEIAGDPDCRVVVVSGAGKIFTAGIDLMDMASDVLQPQGDDTARVSWNLRQKIAKYQETFSVIEKCPKPVVVAVHGACVGGGVDLITACDIRLCTQDAWFQVKEVDIGLAADVGTLQRLPKVIGSSSLVNDLALTARKMYADEAKSSGLVSRVFADKEAMMAGALEMADEIAARSPIAVQGTKINLIYARDHSVAEGLDYMATWNMSMLQTQDVMKSAQAAMEKKSPKTIAFSKL
ncbi:delta(3,5)-Delta(2,4)-dienoyl-CoA isomerase, mitochondrial isoform X1 [Seriola aureovittata]|uniref:delta(3,5)-Delta(2,4)-dienoyl-CoA isomerase, mitochondrial isoform X1 n=1 Tax=Seriola aureovittata TaxID=2871759 RepID=UPI0024BEE527|nr:delta(3,5)-Delta(2,4)-dienoyl-CoA isomerase, mitochondrial isoform X1 [Seriola aureovittata]XP_056230858.1 delta(3,5)-Delta(2,4)-dienoyl-CoA isomerase, mitochondrial isoform X1 [Seriola aureovittata]XP_056230859.1 delta(3,5)-Delta(2,4)-dienoyl-CoA isomerase, mitochondrial isoform X1 [Seriola aureovittata]